MGDRVILHCDLNCFFASVELLDKPALWEVPVAVSGDPKSRHGIILAKNEPAKRRGVKTAETIWQARKKCPGLVLLPPHRELYREYSRRVNEIYDRFTDLVEPFGIDESWLDVTGSLHLFGGDARALADRIRATVRAETGLTLSVGVSFNKVFAKLGSDLKKPDATTVIPRSGWESIVWPLPLGDMLFAGRAATETLKKYGVELLSIVNTYMEEKQLERPEIKKVFVPVPEEKVDTKTLSFRMYKDGMSLEEIAEERSLTEGTVFTHLAHFVKEGELDLCELISAEHAKRIENLLRKYPVEDLPSLSVLKDALEENISYNEIRLIVDLYRTTL